MKRRSFLYLLALVVSGCQSQQPTPHSTHSDPEPQKKPLPYRAGRVLLVNNSQVAIYEINDWAQATKLVNLPSGFHSPLARSGYGPRLCIFTPSSEPGVDSLIQTIQISPAAKLITLPDRVLPEGFMPHLHLAEQDTVLATKSPDDQGLTQILFLDGQGKTYTTSSKLQGEVRLAASLGQLVALFTVEQSLKNKIIGGIVYLFRAKNNRVEQIGQIKVPGIHKIPLNISYISGLAFIYTGDSVQLCVSISSSRAQDAILIYTVSAKGIHQQQNIIGLNTPGTLIAYKQKAAFCQQQNGAIKTYRWGSEKWQAVDSISLPNGLTCPQSLENNGIVYIRTSSDQFWCASLSRQAKLSHPVLISGLPSGDKDSATSILRLVID